MKKISFILGAAAAILSLTTSCNIEENPASENAAVKGSSFELGLQIAETKTTMDASTYAVDWEEGDIVYAVTTDGLWGKPYEADKNSETIAEFKYADGSFTTKSTIADGRHTFNFVYSNGNQKSWHRGAGSTNQLYNGQSQDCAKPTAHIKAYDALVGQAIVTTPTNFVNVGMSHIYTLMEVDVKNNTGADIQIASLEMTAEKELAGVFNINFNDGTTTLNTENTTYKNIKLSVKNGQVADGESLPLYFVMAPLNAYSGNITLSVADSEGNTYTKTIAVSNVTFAAGTYNTTSYTISDCDEVKKVIEDGDYAILASDGTSYYAVSANANGTTKRRDRVAVEYAGGEKIEITHSDAIWSFKAAGNFYTISNGMDYMGAGKNIIPLVTETAAAKALIVANGDGTYTLTTDCGTDGTRIMAMNGSYGFGWYASGTGVSELYLVPAVYVEPTLYDITVSETVNGKVFANPEKAQAGETITIIANPDAGYQLATLTYNGIDIKETKSFTMPAENVTVAATFELAPVSTVLDFTSKAYGNAAYNNEFTYGDWTVVHGANNNKGWDYVKMGGKKATLADGNNPCYIYNNVAIEHSVSKITVALPTGSLSKSGMAVNSWGVYVYSDEAMTNQVDFVAGGTITNAAASFDFVPSEGTSWAEGCYYKVSWDLSNTTDSNGIVCVKKITLFE